MKTLLMMAAVILIAGGAQADPQGGGTITGTVKKGPSTRPSRENALHPGPVSNGVIGRAFQPGGNPLQMLNPKAPAQYGNAATSLAIDPDTGKWAGIKLIEFIF